MGKLEDAKQILEELGLPRGQQNDRSAYTLLALLGLSENSPWNLALNELIGVHDIMVFIAKNYNFQYAENIGNQ